MSAIPPLIEHHVHAEYGFMSLVAVGLPPLLVGFFHVQVCIKSGASNRSASRAADSSRDERRERYFVLEPMTFALLVVLANGVDGLDSPQQPITYDLEQDDKSEYHGLKSEYDEVDEQSPSSSRLQQGLSPKISSARSESIRSGKPSRPILPTVYSGVMTDNVSHNNSKIKRRKSSASKTTNSSQGSQKLGTFEGVFTPTVLSIWSIIVFLRFGYIIAQVGVVATLMMFSVGYLCVIAFYTHLG
jgi:hypothetical protein